MNKPLPSFYAGRYVYYTNIRGRKINRPLTENIAINPLGPVEHIT